MDRCGSIGATQFLFLGQLNTPDPTSSSRGRVHCIATRDLRSMSTPARTSSTVIGTAGAVIWSAQSRFSSICRSAAVSPVSIRGWRLHNPSRVTGASRRLSSTSAPLPVGGDPVRGKPRTCGIPPSSRSCVSATYVNSEATYQPPTHRCSKVLALTTTVLGTLAPVKPGLPMLESV